MLGWNKNKTAIVLIFSSLLLLLLFLSYWLKEQYQYEKNVFHKEISYGLKDIVGSLEDSLIHKVFLQNMTVNLKVEKNGIAPVRKRKIIQTDSIKFVTSSNSIDTETLHSDSTFRMIVHTEAKEAAFPRSSSLLPILINWKEDSLNVNLVNAEAVEKVVDMVSLRFDEYMSKSDFPKDYQMVKLGKEQKHSNFVVEVFQEPALELYYGAEFSNYYWYLIRKMNYQILFCLFLFGAICISFYTIYTNWRKQQKLIEIKNDFISNVTHELKTPISTVSVALEALSSFDVLKDKIKTNEYIDISKQELNRLKILVDKVLKMSIFEKGASQLIIDEMDMNHLLDEVMSSMKIQFERVGATVTKDVEGKDFELEGDKIHLTNVIYNLLDNAIKYGGNTPSINVQLSESNGKVDLYVSDKGIGISKEEQSKVFSRFYRVSTGDTHDVKGHGLGLSYVASVVEQHKGTIEVESRIGRGSTFHICLNKHYGKN